MISTMLFAALLTAQDASVTVTYAHMPLNAFKAAIGGATLNRVGLYSATACNGLSESYKLDEGQLIAHAQQFGVIHPALNLSIIELSQRSTKKYKALTALGYLSSMATFAAGRDGGKDFRFIALALSNGFSKMADGVKARQAVAPELIQALAVPARVVVLDAGACTARLMFGEYRQSFAPYKVQLRKLP